MKTSASAFINARGAPPPLALTRRLRGSLGPQALVLLVALGVARVTLNVTHGLRAEYFENDRRAGTPALTTVDPEISTARLDFNWLDLPPPAFSVRWFGYLTIRQAGDYTFAVSSDDGAWLTIDGKLAIDNGGRHSTIRKTARLHLDEGPHAVLLEYFQAGGEYELSWWWARDNEALSQVPAWLLSPRRIEYWKTVLARVLDWSWWTCVALVIFGGLRLAFQRRGRLAAGAKWLVSRMLVSRPRIASLLFFIGLAIVETWPLAAHPGRLSRNDNGDTVLNEWAIAWVAHEAPRAPLHLFDGNIFYPERDTLAYSEAMIVQGAMGAPLFWLGASPVLTYNVVLILGFALSGWAMCFVIARWTGDWIPGLVSGILFAFNAHSLTRLPHLQAQHVEFLPLALLSLDALLREPRVGHAVRLALWFALEGLTSVYLLVFTSVALVAATLVRPRDWLGKRFLALAPAAVLAIIVAGLILLPFMWPYWQSYRDQGFSRSLEDVAAFSASWQDYLSTPARLQYALWSHLWFSGTALFPGVVGLALAGVAFACGVALRDPRARMCVALGVAGLVFSFGTQVPGYETLYHAIPAFQAIRAVVRYGYLVIVAVAVVAGFGTNELRRRLPANRQTLFACVVVTLTILDSLVAPIWFARVEGISPIYRTIAGTADAVVVEMPFYDAGAGFAHAKYMLNSTLNWKPLVNGYSGFQPPSFYKNAEALRDFPDARSIERLQSLGVTHVFVHINEMQPEVVDRINAATELRRLADDGDIVLYALGPR